MRHYDMGAATDRTGLRSSKGDDLSSSKGASGNGNDNKNNNYGSATERSNRDMSGPRLFRSISDLTGQASKKQQSSKQQPSSEAADVPAPVPELSLSDLEDIIGAPSPGEFASPAAEEREAKAEARRRKAAAPSVRKFDGTSNFRGVSDWMDSVVAQAKADARASADAAVRRCRLTSG